MFALGSVWALVLLVVWDGQDKCSCCGALDLGLAAWNPRCLGRAYGCSAHILMVEQVSLTDRKAGVGRVYMIHGGCLYMIS